MRYIPFAHLMQSLRLAQASGDAMLAAHVLAGMSDQACMLGHPHEALHAQHLHADDQFRKMIPSLSPESHLSNSII